MEVVLDDGCGCANRSFMAGLMGNSHELTFLLFFIEITDARANNSSIVIPRNHDATHFIPAIQTHSSCF